MRKRYKIQGFYGSHGFIQEHDDGSATLEIIYRYMDMIHKDYKTFKNAKIALSKYLDGYSLIDIDSGKYI